MSRVVIAGLGLIGGSIGKALLARGFRVAFVDPAVSLDEAEQAAAAHDRLEALDAIEKEDLVILAMPVDSAMWALDSMPKHEGVVTSVCSVMAPLRGIAEARGLRFVAGHPFAGSELRGLAAADSQLFEGKTWFLDDLPDSGAIEPIIRATGANAVRIDADEHDAALALTSHLPQVISTALASLIEERQLPSEFIGTGLQTLLRLAGSAASVWQPVIAANQPSLIAAREAFELALRRVAAGDGPLDFERANRFSEKK
jgi:prephenate dehydrogenase